MSKTVNPFEEFTKDFKKFTIILNSIIVPQCETIVII